MATPASRHAVWMSTNVNTILTHAVMFATIQLARIHAPAPKVFISQMMPEHVTTLTSVNKSKFVAKSLSAPTHTVHTSVSVPMEKRWMSRVDVSRLICVERTMVAVHSEFGQLIIILCEREFQLSHNFLSN